jgi:hypothetical protein
VDVSNTRVILLGDRTAWQPPAALQQLWTYLRLLLLESIWMARCVGNGRPFTAVSVTARFRAALQQQLKQYWARSQGDIRHDLGVPLSWLRGRSPVLPPQQFAVRWQASGAHCNLCTLILKKNKRSPGKAIAAAAEAV